MDRVNEGPFDQMIEDAIRCEPLAELPVDFRQLFLDQVKAEVKPKFQVLSLVDLISSIIIAMTIGIGFLISAFLPEHLTPRIQWFWQWGEYLLTKAVFKLPGIVLTLGVIVLAFGILVGLGKGLQVLFKKNKFGLHLL
jgi:hypothetical protein